MSYMVCDDYTYTVYNVRDMCATLLGAVVCRPRLRNVSSCAPYGLRAGDGTRSGRTRARATEGSTFIFQSFPENRF